MKRWYAYTAAIALISSALICSTAVAATPELSGFSAIQGVSAQALSANEMQEISGQFNAYDIAYELNAVAAKLAKFPKLQADTLKLAAWYSANAATVNAAFQKLHLYTPCQHGCPSN